MASKLGKTALYYRKNSAARKRRLVQQTEYESTSEQRSYRSKLSALRVKRKLKGNPKDLSHQKNGKIVLESRKKNRQRNGSGGASTLK